MTRNGVIRFKSVGVVNMSKRVWDLTIYFAVFFVVLSSDSIS